MKFFSAAVALAVAGSSVSAETCVLTQLATSLGGLISDATACQTATGYQILPPTAYPTAAQTKAICADCQALITGARNVTFPTCTLNISGSEVQVNTLFSTIVGECSGSSGSSNGTTEITTPTPTSTSSGSSNSSTTTAPTSAPTTSTPSTTTASPSTTTSAGISAAIGAAVTVACSVAMLSL